MTHSDLLFSVHVSREIATACERHATEREEVLNRRGLELRRSILDEYARLKANKSEIDGHDLTSIISQYIPAGTLFPDAIAILKAGDFPVRPPSSHRYGKNEIFLVAAHILLDQVS